MLVFLFFFILVCFAFLFTFLHVTLLAVAVVAAWLGGVCRMNDLNSVLNYYSFVLNFIVVYFHSRMQFIISAKCA